METSSKGIFLLNLMKYVDILEMVEKTGINLVTYLRKYSYDDRLQKLGITTLKVRRIWGDLIATFNLLTGKEKTYSNLTMFLFSRQ